MLHYTSKYCNKGVKIWFPKDDRVFNIHRLMAKTKMTYMLLHDLLHTDDYALTANSKEDAQSIVKDLIRPAITMVWPLASRRQKCYINHVQASFPTKIQVHHSVLHLDLSIQLHSMLQPQTILLEGWKQVLLPWWYHLARTPRPMTPSWLDQPG